MIIECPKCNDNNFTGEACIFCNTAGFVIINEEEILLTWVEEALCNL